MGIKVSLHQLKDRLAEFLDDAVTTGEECIVQRNGKDYAVIISAQEWRRRTVKQRLDALGPAYRLSKEKQSRAEELLASSKEGCLTSAERRELKALLRAGDAVLLRRAKALDRVV